MGRGKRKNRRGVLIICAALVLVCGGVWVAAERVIGTSIFVRYSGTLWIPADENSFWLPQSMKLALHSPAPLATPGGMTWQEVAPGFDVAELPALVGDVEVDRILLARVDPAHYSFVVRNDRSATSGLDRWMDKLGAALVINGSYYSRAGTPATPVVIDGAPAGPTDYVAAHGAFISSPQVTEIRDLAQDDWHAAFQGVEAAMISYPILLAEDGSSRVPPGRGWLANRSFLAQDRDGRIIFGTTKGGFFSLDRLSGFLRQSALDLKIVLNLDGGPVACQGIALAGFKRTTCDHWEAQIDQNGAARFLPTWPLGQPPMPIVLAVFPKP